LAIRALTRSNKTRVLNSKIKSPLPRNSPPAVRERDALPRMLQQADDYAAAALYLLELEEMGTLARMREGLRRRLRPDQQDKDTVALTERLMNPVPEPGQ
jgi:hypothetical protein